MTLSHFKLKATLVAEEPIHLGTGRTTGVIKHSYPYIPGSFIRGSTSTLLVKLLCKLDRPLVNHEECEYFDECRYIELFGEPEKASNIFFRYAYPLHLKCDGVYRPVSKDLYRCQNSQCGETYQQEIPPQRCKVCGGKVTPVRGYVCDRCAQLNRRPIRLVRVTSTAIDRPNHVAATISTGEGKRGTLHTLEAVPKGSSFNLEAVFSPKIKEGIHVLQSVMKKGLTDEGIGGSRSRGYGKTSIKELKLEKVSTKDIENRAEKINPSHFKVEALSPLILDEALKPSTLLEGARRAYSWAFHEGKPCLPDIKLKTQRAEATQIGGWSQKKGQRRPLVQGYAPGSVFYFICQKPEEALSKALAALETYPLGSYKPHGCGVLKIKGAN